MDEIVMDLKEGDYVKTFNLNVERDSFDVHFTRYSVYRVIYMGRLAICHYREKGRDNEKS